jgi:uncharacterized protein
MLPRYYLAETADGWSIVDVVTNQPIATHPDQASALLAFAVLMQEEDDEVDEANDQAEADAMRDGPLTLCLRAAPEGTRRPIQIVGYAAVFNEAARIRDTVDGEPLTFTETIAPGAFASGLADSSVDPVALAHHDPAQVLGRRSAGTLRLREDLHGLAVEIDPPDTTLGRDLVESIRRGDLRGMSLGFAPRAGGLEWSSDYTACTVRDAVAAEVSIVTWPAYRGTSVALRSRAGAIAACSQARAARARRILRAVQMGRLIDATRGI